MRSSAPPNIEAFGRDDEVETALSGIRRNFACRAGIVAGQIDNHRAVAESPVEAEHRPWTAQPARIDVDGGGLVGRHDAA